MVPDSDMPAASGRRDRQVLAAVAAIAAETL